MPTQRAIIESLIERTGLGRYGFVSAGGDTSSVIDTDELQNPVASEDWAIRKGSPVFIADSETNVGRHYSYVESFDNTAGDLTINPVIPASLTPGTSGYYQVWNPDVQSARRVFRALDRSLSERCGRWMKLPFTSVADGDCEARGTADWSATTATLAKASITASAGHPARQALQVTNTGANGYAESTALACVPNDSWFLDLLLRGSADATVVNVAVQDLTNSAAITLSGGTTSGDTTQITGQAWRNARYTFTIPTGCRRFALRLGSTGAATVAQFTHIISRNQVDRYLPLPPRVVGLSKLRQGIYERLGNEVGHFRFDGLSFPLGGFVSHGAAALAYECRRFLPSNYPVYFSEWRNYDSFEVTSTLASAITVGATTLSVAAGDGPLFGSPNFFLTVGSETMLCTGRTGDALTVTRNQHGTTAVAHGAGEPIRLHVDDDTATTDCELEYAVAGTACELLQAMRDRTMTTRAPESDRWAQPLDYWRRRWMALSRARYNRDS